MMALNPESFANRVLDECSSTNDLARILGETGYPHGTWVSASRQVSGRGRSGRIWQSEKGNLFLSVVSRLESKSLWSWIPLASTISVLRAIRYFAEDHGALKIKWPNDLYCDGAKLGGVLCEGVGNSRGSFVVIGIGMNVVSSPEGLDQQTQSLAAVDWAKENQIEVEPLRAKLIQCLIEDLKRLSLEGPDFLKRFYERNAYLKSGSQIFWEDGKRVGQVLGLGAFGELLVRDEQGIEIKLFSEDVRVRPFPATSD
jgi:BirA family biotin operon repressor/biotin-[acetyl-CoA-carboxylase] ligase